MANSSRHFVLSLLHWGNQVVSVAERLPGVEFPHVLHHDVVVNLTAVIDQPVVLGVSPDTTKALQTTRCSHIATCQLHRFYLR